MQIILFLPIVSGITRASVHKVKKLNLMLPFLDANSGKDYRKKVNSWRSIRLAFVFIFHDGFFKTNINFHTLFLFDFIVVVVKVERYSYCKIWSLCISKGHQGNNETTKKSNQFIHEWSRIPPKSRILGSKFTFEATIWVICFIWKW